MTDSKSVYHRLTPSFERRLSKFQTDLASSFVLIAIESRQVCLFATMEKKNIGQ